jgi:mono/diheme cytochrome c family protein
MKRKVLLALGGLVGIVVLAAGGLVGFSAVSWDNPRDIDEVTLSASTDPAVIDRGRYLAYGPAHCAYCHNTMENWPRLDAGEHVPLVGGGEFALPFGKFYAPNLTPDDETGIGRATDAQIARMLRHNIRVSGRVAIPFMEFQNLSDEDVVAVISFLRSQEPVHNEVPAAEVSLLGKVLMTFMIKPVDGTPPATAPAEEITIERGRYVATNIANCAGCHTKRSMVDGSYLGEPFTGGMVMTLDGDESRALVSPNLTPAAATGRITGWSEDQFVARFRAGPQFRESHMPWNAFMRMSDTDLRAIYRFLRSLEPIENETPVGIVDVASLEE